MIFCNTDGFVSRILCIYFFPPPVNKFCCSYYGNINGNINLLGGNWDQSVPFGRKRGNGLVQDVISP